MLSRTNRNAAAGSAWAAAVSTVPPNRVMAMTAGWAMVEAAGFGLATGGSDESGGGRTNMHSERVNSARQTLALGGKLMWDGYTMLPAADRAAGLGVAIEASKALLWGSDNSSDAVEALTTVLADRPQSFEALQMLADAIVIKVRGLCLLYSAAFSAAREGRCVATGRGGSYPSFHFGSVNVPNQPRGDDY